MSESFSCPVPATLFVTVIAVGLGAIPLGSETAFLALAGSFIILTTVSYSIPFVANMCTRRRFFPPGPFSLGDKWGYIVNGTAVIFIVFFDVMFCFPHIIPLTGSEMMNWNSAILVSTIGVTTLWWLVHAKRNYPGPKVLGLYVKPNCDNSRTRFCDDVTTGLSDSETLGGGGRLQETSRDNKFLSKSRLHSAEAMETIE